MYGDEKIAPVKATQGKIHKYLAMKLDYSEKGVIKLNMVDYVKAMVNNFPEGIPKSKYPWKENLFKIDDKSPLLNKERHELFHTFVAKGLFLCKRARPDIQPAIALLATRVQSLNKQDWSKLLKVLAHLNHKSEEVLILQINNSPCIKWYVDAAFAVHHDKKSHTGANMTLGNGSIYSMSTKQKINTRSSTEAELVSLDDVISKILWVKRFMEAQGWNIIQNVILCDNVSLMKLEENGKSSSGKRTQHFDIKYFYISDLIK
jgi:hypothetical protein